MFKSSLKQKLEEAEAVIAEQTARLDGMERLMTDRTALVSIAKVNSRVIRFGFIRNGTMTYVETYADMSLNVDELRRTLLERQPADEA